MDLYLLLSLLFHYKTRVAIPSQLHRYLKS
nr:MAG TPA: hypothetical protein [Caudoviricetes sp.]